MAAARDYACPACRARFRGAARCSRCGADLTALMRLAVEAHRARAEARGNLAEGDYSLAAARASAAQERCATPQGARLLTLARWLVESGEKKG